jgi:hypothetical protein
MKPSIDIPRRISASMRKGMLDLEFKSRWLAKRAFASPAEDSKPAARTKRSLRRRIK